MLAMLLVGAVGMPAASAAGKSLTIQQAGSATVTELKDRTTGGNVKAEIDGKTVNGTELSPQMAQMAFTVGGAINDAATLDKGDTVTIPISSTDGSHYAPGIVTCNANVPTTAGVIIFTANCSEERILLTATDTVDRLAGKISFYLQVDAQSMFTPARPGMTATSSTWTVGNSRVTFHNTVAS